MWAGIDSVWEQENADARKMLENAAREASHMSRVRCTLFSTMLSVVIAESKSPASS
jgi:hypothetical protein